MIGKIILIGLIVAGLYGYNNMGSQPNDPLVSVAPREKIEQKVDQEIDPNVSKVKDIVLKFLPGKQEWPEPARVMYHMVFMDEVIKPIQVKSDYRTLDSFGNYLPQAIIAVEDHDFYQHSAISIDSIIRAAMINSSAGEILQGGSTLTQQLVKNLFLSSEQTLSRKIFEAMLALIMENKYSKDQILELYLNSIYFGMDCTGVCQASDKLFGKFPSTLRLEEAALIAGLPNAPDMLNPFVNPKAAKERQIVVLEAMQTYGFINQNQCWRAKAADIYLRNGEIISYEDKMVL